MKAKSRLIPFFTIIGIALIIVAIVIYLVLNLPIIGQNLPSGPPTSSPDRETDIPSQIQPIPNVPILIQKQGSNTITVTNLGGPDSNTVAEFVVTVNGVITPNKLGITPGQSLVITSKSNPNTVIVTANFKDGTSFVVSNKYIE